VTDQAHLTAEKTYRAIGRFVFEFSQLEYAIRHYVAEEVGVMTEYFNAIMTHDFATLCTGAIEVFRHSYSDKRERFEKMERLLNRARTLGNERNSVAHGLWVPFQDGGKVIHVPRSLKAKISTEQAKTLEEKADQANALRAEIEALALDME
jgi:hypothetical protein